MAEKRKRPEAGASTSPQKKRKGFQVGPANLPDGTYKRKTQKIKESLIERANIKKNYAKLRKLDTISKDAEGIPEPASLAADKKRQEDEANSEDNQDPNDKDDAEPENTGPHPDRQNLIDDELEAPAKPDPTDRPQRERKRRPKAVPFKREYDAAQQRKAEAEERRKAREEAEKQREEKRAEREKFRSAMAKARRGGPNGQRKLGRESTVLLERVKKMMG
ncbi:Hypothetical protein R9X50_00154200 [Acrodontium crateriforme]|uniref:rRNA-processing protein FYV7 n=1 Tax=Acrodontium crateriforme TaxID=150365 RepID=A0AAQ3LZN6_9PEZI|nr:Hypothetical protein R9X50_00154200 [Acrodontium crateriforme]